MNQKKLLFFLKHGIFTPPCLTGLATKMSTVTALFRFHASGQLEGALRDFRVLQQSKS